MTDAERQRYRDAVAESRRTGKAVAVYNDAGKRVCFISIPGPMPCECCEAHNLQCDVVEKIAAWLEHGGDDRARGIAKAIRDGAWR